MSGHSKWSTIKRKKGAADAKRGKIFTKLIREITVAARTSGGDPDGNPRLRKALSEARAENMSRDNIERAVKRGTGELEGVSYEEITYEAYGPGGAAVICETMTDNRNRTVPELRKILERHSGKLATPGSVSFLFQKRGVFTFEASSIGEDRLTEIAIDVGADDVRNLGQVLEVLCDPGAFESVREGFEKAGLHPVTAELGLVPQTTVPLAGRDAEVMLRLVETLEDHDDVQHVWANFQIEDAELERLSSSV